MIESALMQYGSIGIFAAYLIYDKQVLMSKIIKTLENLTHKIEYYHSIRDDERRII